MVRLNRKTIVNGEPCAPRGARTVREGVSTSGLPHNLDTEVSRLRLLKAAHQSQQYAMEDRLLKYFPEQIQSSKRIIAGFQDDLAMRDTHPLPHEGFVGMEVGGSKFNEKEDAGKAILEACKTVKDLQTIEIGRYRGFTMSLSVENFGRDYVLSFKGEMAHAVALGTDPRGNIQRIDNMLAAMEERIQQTQAQLSNLEQQQEAARQEVGRSFPQEDELRQKGTRLAEVDAQLNLEVEQVVETTGLRAEGDEQMEQPMEKPSVLEALKKAKADMPMVKKALPHHEREIR